VYDGTKDIWGTRINVEDQNKRQYYWALVQAAVQPLRILIGFAQIVAQLGQVLHVEYPPIMTKVIGFMRPLLADVWGLFVHLDCVGLGNAYAKYMLYVFVLPLCFLAAVLVRYLCHRHSNPTARMQLSSNTFVVIFLCYPTVCNHAFGLLNCRVLSEELTVLADDYSTKCTTGEHMAFQGTAIGVIVVIAFGIPLGFTAILLSKARKFDGKKTEKTARAVAIQMHISESEAADIIREVAIGKDYGFLLRAYGPRHFCFENFDMLRKLLLVGILVVVSRGSVAQVNCAACLSFGFSVLHFKMWPYKMSWDNRFKACVEAQIWFTILIALTLKSDLSAEVVDETFYDRIMLLLFVINIPVAFSCTVVAKLRHTKWLLEQRVINPTDTVAREQALAFHCAGLASEDDTQILRDFFESLLLLDLDSLAAQIEGRSSGGDTVALETVANIDGSSVPFCWTVTEQNSSLVSDAEPGARCRHTIAAHESSSNISVTQHEPAAESQLSHASSADLHHLHASEPTTELATPQTGDVVPTDYYDKYSTGFVGAFGGAGVFFGGLTGLIGDCRRDVLAAMQTEHCSTPSGFGASDKTFQTSNYKVNTTPRKEWLFVYSPELLAEALSAGVSQSTGQRLGSRAKQPYQWYTQHAPRLISAKFTEAGYKVSVSAEEFSSLQVRAEEIIGLRLYTGPVS
jgi:hypothetical protein